MAAARKKPAPKRGASRYQAPAKKPVPGWVWMACGLVIGGFLVMLMNLEPGRNEIKRERVEANKPNNSTQPNTQKQAETPTNRPKYDFYTLLPESEVIVPPDAQQAIQTPPPAKPVTAQEAAKIDAERALAALEGKTPPPPPVVATPTTNTAPSAPITTPPANTAAQTAPTATASPSNTLYFLQAGSFRKASDADRVRAQIILLGQNVQVESGTVRDEVWYRVMVGPFASREQLNSAQKNLAGSGFGNLLPQQRQRR